MNGGGLASGAEPATTPVYSATNGGWNSGTGLWTAASGSISGVSVGDFAHVFADGATTPTFIGRVTAFNASGPATITVSKTAKGGTLPATAASGISINVGGAWRGPTGSTIFPFNFVNGSMLNNTSTDSVRVNFKNDQTYNVTAPCTHTLIGPAYWQGYTTTFGDLGKATLDGGTSGASYILISTSGSGVDRNYLVDFIIQNNGATGVQNGCQWGGSSRSYTLRCVARNIRGSGFAADYLYECEAYACNQSNTAALGAFRTNVAVRCIAHGNPGSNSDGFYTQSAPGFNLINCISAGNGRHGFFEQNVTGGNQLIGCDAYNNGGDGYNHVTSGIMSTLINSNFISNGGYGINIQSGNSRGQMTNCGLYNNTSGPTNNAQFIEKTGTVTYSGVPYVDAPNGDFRLSAAAAKGTGRGAFTQIAPGYGGTTSYPDIGAAQHQDAGGGGLLVHPGMSGGMV